MLNAKRPRQGLVATQGVLRIEEEHWREHSWGRSTRSPRAIDLDRHVNDESEVEEEGIDPILAWGVLLIVVAVLVLSFATYSMVISKLLPSTGNRILDAIKEDRYYVFLIPLTVPVTFVAVYFHWLSLKFFKHA